MSLRVAVASVLIVALAIVQPARALSIEDFGGVPDNTTYEQSWRNGRAFYDMLHAANDAEPGARIAVVPRGKVFTMLPWAIIDGLKNVTLSIEGTLNAFPGDMFLWPNSTTGRALRFIDIHHSSDVTINGGGTIQGNGYRWWWYALLSGNDNRPHLLWMRSCINSVMENLTFLNSPNFHIYWQDALVGLIDNVTVHVDVDDQRALLGKFGKLSADGLPIFPLNTDGIDIAGQDIVVRNCRVTNFDDALCAKPMTGAGNLTHCTRNLTFENSEITWGVGASVGSVGPDPDVNCVRDTTFRNLRFHHPIKTIYIKPNPVLDPATFTNGTGVIDNITYENIYAEDTMWWTIWVSTQQQAQPGNGTNTHCSFFYPLPNTTCPLDYRVPVTNLKLRNITAVRSLLSPGVLRCDPRGPCTGWEWSDVNITSVTKWPMQDNFLCEGIINPRWTNVNVNCTSKLPVW
jgi:hypothetical protein